jgi:hypothetical protein
LGKTERVTKKPDKAVNAHEKEAYVDPGPDIIE